MERLPDDAFGVYRLESVLAVPGNRPLPLTLNQVVTCNVVATLRRNQKANRFLAKLRGQAVLEGEMARVATTRTSMTNICTCREFLREDHAREGPSLPPLDPTSNDCPYDPEMHHDRLEVAHWHRRLDAKVVRDCRGRKMFRRRLRGMMESMRLPRMIKE